MSDTTTIEDLDFPKAVLTRIIKSSLPENISIQKEARHGVSKASTVFVSYLAATANDCARESGHKTIMTSDVFKALEAIGLADFIDRLKSDLDAFVTRSKEKKKSATAADNDDDDDEENIQEVGEEAEEESAMDVDESSDAAKRPRIE
ncbi:hypothetical protein IWW37_003873 [Coemansia sp. RSA 2050]|nr:hypothetical protein IWW37_003873 [Coemansia sp. RSA 2050]